MENEEKLTLRDLIYGIIGLAVFGVLLYMMVGYRLVEDLKRPDVDATQIAEDRDRDNARLEQWLNESQNEKCDPSYPTVCIFSGRANVNCKDVRPYHNFRVLPPDPYNLDGDHDGIGCEDWP